MNNKVIDCISIAQKIKNDVKMDILSLENQPHLVVVVVGEDPASQVYVRNKHKVCEEVGIKSTIVRVREDITQQGLEVIVKNLNEDDSVHGLLVQLPLPKHLDEQRIAELIDWKKDVDAFHPVLQGKLMRGEDLDVIPLPCTAVGCIKILKEEGVNLSGKRIAVVGRSNIVGKPVSMLCLHENATVTMCHSRTLRLQSVTKQADIVICAVGKAKMFDYNYFSGGQYVLDVGINRDINGKLCGDVDIESVFNARDDMCVTPVPRGLGLLTVACLMENTIKCYNLQQSK